MGQSLAAALVVVAASWYARPAPRRLREVGLPADGVGPSTVDEVAGTGLVVCLLVSAGGVLPAMAAIVACLGVAAWRHRSSKTSQMAVIEAELPDVIDLFALAVGAGLTVHLAVEAVAHRCPGPLGTRLAALASAQGDERLADALDRLPVLAGEAVRPLAAALAASERYGAPLASALSRLADDARHRQVRRAEERSRRLPVLLLFPLVFCILPAFALLTVAPLLAGSLRSLRL